jgi:hypothetical protein
MAGIWLHLAHPEGLCHLRADGCSHHGEISPGKPGWLVVKCEYNPAIVVAIKQLAGHRWNPEFKLWTVADTLENRTRLTDLAAHPPKASIEYLSVAPLLCHTLAGGWGGYTVHSRAAGTRQYPDNRAVHPRDAEWYGACQEPAGRVQAVGRQNERSAFIALRNNSSGARPKMKCIPQQSCREI